MSPYANELALARLDALRALVGALEEADNPAEKRRCAVAILNCPDPNDLDDTIELVDDDEDDDDNPDDTTPDQADSEESDSDEADDIDVADPEPADIPTQRAGAYPPRASLSFPASATPAATLIAAAGRPP